MRVIQGEEIAFQNWLEHRAGQFQYKILAEGEAGDPGNYRMGIGEIGDDFFSPRHRHNFEQLRYQLEGVMDFGRNGKLKPGMVGYFPEGVAYGPQTQKGNACVATLTLQFGGASGSGYLSKAEVKAGTTELLRYGQFVNGVYKRRPDVPGKRNMDSYQAIWKPRTAAR